MIIVVHGLKGEISRSFSVLFLMFAILSSCSVTEKEDNKTLLAFCGAENKIEQDGLTYYLDGKNKFLCDSTQSNSVSHTGKHSDRLTVKKAFGMQITINDVQGDDVYEVDWFEKGQNLNFIAAIKGEFVIYKDSGEVKGLHKGWKHKYAKIYVPAHIKNGTLILAFQYIGNKVVFLDDFSVYKVEQEKFPMLEKKSYLNLLLGNDSFEKLRINRLAKQKKGIEFNTKEWVSAHMAVGVDTMAVKIRIKGDRLIHTKGKKWSFRIKIKDNKTWKGMTEFSIHRPEAREFMDEWLFHKFLKSEKIPTTEYGFVPVTFKGENLGIYAFEEHTGEQFFRNRNIKNPLVLRFSEDHYWRWQNLGGEGSFPYYKASTVLCSSDIKGNQNQTYAINRLRKFQQHNGGVEEFFDTTSTPDLYATIDIFNAYHALCFINERFYFNKNTKRITQIGRDGFTSHPEPEFPLPFLAYSKTDTVREIWDAGFIFNDSIFLKNYLKALKKFSSNGYLANYVRSVNKEIKETEELIQKEYPNYQFDYQKFLSRSNKINEALSDYDVQFSEFNPFWEILPTSDCPLSSETSDWVDLGVIVQSQYNQTGEKLWLIKNYLNCPIEISGSGVDKFRIQKKMSVRISPCSEILMTDVQNENNYLFYSLDSITETFATKILAY